MNQNKIFTVAVSLAVAGLLCFQQSRINAQSPPVSLPALKYEYKNVYVSVDSRTNKSGPIPEIAGDWELVAAVPMVRGFGESPATTGIVYTLRKQAP